MSLSWHDKSKIVHGCREWCKNKLEICFWCKLYLNSAIKLINFGKMKRIFTVNYLLYILLRNLKIYLLIYFLVFKIFSLSLSIALLICTGKIKQTDILTCLFTV